MENARLLLKGVGSFPVSGSAGERDGDRGKTDGQNGQPFHVSPRLSCVSKRHSKAFLTNGTIRLCDGLVHGADNPSARTPPPEIPEWPGYQNVRRVSLPSPPP